MTKAELISAIASDANISKKSAGDALESLIASITKVLKKDDAVTLTGFGTYKISHRKARQGINPQTGAKLQIPARKVPVFRPGKALKDAVR